MKMTKIDRKIILLFCIIDPILLIYTRVYLPLMNVYNPIYAPFAENVVIFSFVVIATKVLFGLMYDKMRRYYSRIDKDNYFAVARACIFTIVLLAVVNNAIMVVFK